jgi:hypothetical protein
MGMRCDQVSKEQLAGKLVTRQQALDLATSSMERIRSGGFRCTQCGKVFSRIIGGNISNRIDNKCWDSTKLLVPTLLGVV